MSDENYIKIGWWLFTVCAVLFCINSWRFGDWLGLAGSLAFLAANVSFMVPVYRRRDGDDE